MKRPSPRIGVTRRDYTIRPVGRACLLLYSSIVRRNQGSARNRAAMYFVNLVAIAGHRGKAEYWPSFRTPLTESFLLSVLTGLHTSKHWPCRSRRKRNFTARWRRMLRGPHAKRNVKRNWLAGCGRLDTVWFGCRSDSAWGWKSGQKHSGDGGHTQCNIFCVAHFYPC